MTTNAATGTPRRARLARRGRATVLWAILCFVTGTLAFNVVMDRWKPELLDPKFGYRLARLKARMREKPGRPLALVLGSSHTEMGIVPEVLTLEPLADGHTPLLFNFALSGSQHVTQLNTLKRILDAGILPRWLVVEVNAASLEAEAIPGEMARLNVQCLRWRDLSLLKRYVAQPRKMYVEWFQDRLCPWFANRFLLMNRYAPEWLPAASRLEWRHSVRPFGTVPLPFEDTPPDNHRKATDYARAEYSSCFSNYRMKPDPNPALRQMIELCRQKGIQVALVRLPEGSEFRSWHPPQAREPVDQFLVAFGREYGIPVFDCRTWIPDNDFWDAHHLLPRGAKAFTQRFAGEMLQPFLEGKPAFTSMASAPTAGAKPTP